MSVDLSRYLAAHRQRYTIVYTQLMDKYYDSGWIEFVFPRYLKDCNSDKSKYYGLQNEKEVQSFWGTKLLRRDYIEMLKVINRMTREEYYTIFSDRGRFRIRQSLEIFTPLAKDDDKLIMENFIKKFY